MPKFMLHTPGQALTGFAFHILGAILTPFLGFNRLIEAHGD